MKKKFPTVFLVFAIVIFVFAVSMSLMLMNYNRVMGVTGIILLSIFAAVMAVISGIYMRNTMQYISKMNDHLENSVAEYMNALPAPIAVIDSRRRFVWYNQIFTEKISLGSDLYGLDFEGFVKMDVDALETESCADCHINGAVYKVHAEKFDKDDISFRVLYFHDETAYSQLKKQTDNSKPNVVILTIDNYDEIMQSAKESEKAQASVETEKLIEKFMSGTNGFIKKTSSNTFFAVMESRCLKDIISDKFKILDEARNIKIASKYQLTFSIGVGQGASTLAESEQIARQCLDMALGRGGDQAVVKTNSGYRFFGGVSKGIEKKSKSKTRIIANALQDLIMNADSVYLMGHRFGDLDSVGASAGLAGACKLLGKEVHIAVDRPKNLASNLIDIVEEKSADYDLFITPSEAVSSINDRDILIITDTHNKDYIESRELYEKARQVVVIDHHRKTVNFIDNSVIFHHEPFASSACEMVTEIIEYFKFENNVKIESYYADALLSGIMLDTKNFVMRTGVRTFEAAAYLRKLGADTVAVKLLFSNSIESYKRKTQIVASAKVHERCAISAVDFKSDDIRIVSSQAADELLNISDVDASFVVYKSGSTTNISARSFGAVNVQVIMEHLGGGGHQTMAAAQIEDVTVQEAVKMLIKAIDERQNEVSEV